MRALQFYNSKTKQKEIFDPITPGQIKMYVCGMTVYDYCHIGHGRMMACFDSLVRAFRAMGYAVTYVRNITDIDDKIIKRANENHESIHTLTTRFIEAMNEDAKALNILPPDISPKATEYVDKMIALIQQLIDKNLAYAAANGDVYYAVNAFPTYGALSGQELDKLRSGVRVDVAEEKRDPLDFVLWKKAKPEEPSWPSPWGQGRPGWHIECSAMSCDLLGKHFDIHGGGMDLLFPHHENEVAQSVGAYDAPFVNTWLHCGFVQIDQEKMSKSLGNFFTIRDVLAKIPAEVLRYFLVASHYRSPLNFSEEGLQQAAQGLDRIYFSLRDLPLEKAKKAEGEIFSEKFYAALADDFNAPEAFAVLFELVREINRLKSLDQEKAASLGKLCVELASVFGIAQKDPQDYFQQAGKGLDAKEVDALIEKREHARKNKDWKTADQMRDTLQAMGVVLEDTPQGVQWRYNKES